MYEVYERWPKIAEECWKLNLESLKFENVNHIVFAGMGGSGAIGDLFHAIFSKTSIHITLVKGYVLPKTIDQNTLVICISVSGDTDETLSILEQIMDIDCKKMAISSGGRVEEFCQKSNIKYFKTPMIHSPRGSFPAFLYSMLNILQPILPLTKNDILDSIEELKKMQKIIGINNLENSNPAIQLANWITGTPVILYPYGFQAAAIRFKNSLQENAKNHAMIEDVIETCHNGIVSWELKSNVCPIMIEGENDHEKTKERWLILKEFFQENNIEFKEIFSIKGNILSKLISLIYMLDYSTIYKAVLNEIDPTPTKSINFIKERCNMG
jgi:glucose/mannose-6-phosphate isomerase